MKKLLYIIPLLLGMALTSCYDEDIDQLNDRLDKVEREVDAIQALLDAYNKQLHIIDIEEVSEGYIVTFSDDSTITIRRGKDGDSHIVSIVVGDTTVTFTLSNGEVITLPLSVTFGIVFDTPEVLMCDPGKSTTVAYTITGGDEGTMVEAWGDSGWSAEVIAKSPTEGVVKVTAPSNSRSGKIVVLAISGEGRSVMKTLYFVDEIYVNLSAVDTANCYIVESAGYYKFDGRVIGNGLKGVIADANFHTTSVEITPSDVEVVWDDNDVVSELRLEDGFIYFKASSNEGNALIAAKDSDGRIIWSWHIWATDKPRDYTSYDGYQTIDRNLGAISANYADGEDTYGYYYQWGRKDPLRNYSTVVNTDETTGCISYTIEHPTQLVGGDFYNWQYSDKSEYLWGYEYNTKTIYDPCPVGYKVPFPVTSSSAYTYDSSRAGGRWDGELWYPFAGRLDFETGTFGNKDWYGQEQEYGCCGFYYVNTYSNYSKNDTYDQYINDSMVLIDNLQYKGFAESVRCIRE